MSNAPARPAPAPSSRWCGETADQDPELGEVEREFAGIWQE